MRLFTQAARLLWFSPIIQGMFPREYLIFSNLEAIRMVVRAPAVAGRTYLYGAQKSRESVSRRMRVDFQSEATHARNGRPLRLDRHALKFDGQGFKVHVRTAGFHANQSVASSRAEAGGSREFGARASGLAELFRKISAQEIPEGAVLTEPGSRTTVDGIGPVRWNFWTCFPVIFASKHLLCRRCSRRTASSQIAEVLQSLSRCQKTAESPGDSGGAEAGGALQSKRIEILDLPIVQDWS